MTGYTRQSATDILDGLVVEAQPLNDEFNMLQSAFTAGSGHSHDGSPGGGAPITAAGPALDVNFGSLAVYPRLTNVVDLGTSVLKFKNLYLSGSIYRTDNSAIDVDNLMDLVSAQTVTGVKTLDANLVVNNSRVIQTRLADTTVINLATVDAANNLKFSDEGVSIVGVHADNLFEVFVSDHLDSVFWVNSTGAAGDGSQLTNLNANAIATGTVADARLPATVVRTSRTLTGVDGIATIGDLSADRNIGLTGQALSYHQLATNGLVTRTAAGTITARTLTAGSGIAVTSGNGVAGDPTVAVDSTVIRTTGGQSISNDLYINGAANTHRELKFTTAGSLRFSIGVDSKAESSVDGEAGSDFEIRRYTNAGTLVDRPLYIDKATGRVHVSAGITSSGSVGAASLSAITTITGANITATSGITSLGAVTAPSFVGSGSSLTDVVFPSRSVLTGGGLSGGGDLSADRTLSVDATVVRTSGDQSISGLKTFSNSLTLENNFSYRIKDSVGAPRSVITLNNFNEIGVGNTATNLTMVSSSPAGTVTLNLGATTALSANASYVGVIQLRSLQNGSVSAPSYSFVNFSDSGMFVGGTGNLGFTVGGVLRGSVNTVGFVGDGSQLTALSAGNISTGTIDIARTPRATQAEAEAGTLNTVLMTPLRSQQLISSNLSSVTTSLGTNFPVGSFLIATHTGSDIRGTTRVLYTDTGDSSIYVTGAVSNAGTVMPGSWAARGRITGNVHLYQRVT